MEYICVTFVIVMIVSLISLTISIIKQMESRKEKEEIISALEDCERNIESIIDKSDDDNILELTDEEYEAIKEEISRTFSSWEF